MNRFARYAIDILNSRHISGWCFDLMRKKKPVKLRFYGDNQKLGEIVANDYREDLQSYRLHPNGLCGFEFHYPKDINVRNYNHITLYINNSKKPLYRVETDQIPIVIEDGLPNVFFMHIPKTAGTSFNTFSRSYFPQDKTIIHIESEDKETYPILEKEKNYLSGHLSIQKIKESFDVSRFDLHTIIREPYSHLHSHLRWVKRLGADRKSGFFKKHHNTIQDISIKLNETDLTIGNNLRALIGNLKGIELDFFDNLQTRYFLDYRPEKVEISDFVDAKKNISLFKSIGLTEKYPQFIQNFCNIYQMENIKKPSTPLNKSSYRRLFDYDDLKVRSILAPLVEADLLLYSDIVKSYSMD